MRLSALRLERPALGREATLRQPRPPGHRAKGAQAGQERAELFVGQSFEEAGQRLSPMLGELPEDVGARFAHVDDDQAAVIGVRQALDQAALLHAVDDAGRARHRNVERVRQMAHRLRTVRLEDGEHVQVHEAERTGQPGLERLPAIAGIPGRELFEDVVRERRRRASLRAERIFNGT